MLFGLFIVFCGILSGQKIKIAAYWTSPNMTIMQAEALAKFDLLIIDFENNINNPTCLNLIRSRNPDVKLLAYSNPFEIWDQPVADRPLQSQWIKEITEKYPNWLLTTTEGYKVIFYEGMRLTNMTSVCMRYHVSELGFINYHEWMSNNLLLTVLSNPIWDGYFMDNAGGNVSWVNNLIDADLNKQPDNESELDIAHASGVHDFLKKIREAKGCKFIITGNKGSVEFIDALDGRMFEFFPNNYLGDESDFGFWQSLTNAKQTGNYTIILVKPSDIDFGYAAVRLLGNNAYLAIGHNNTRYYEQFDYELGNPDQDQIIIQISTNNGLITIDPSRKKSKITFK